MINSVDIKEFPAMIEEFKAFTGLIDKNRQLKSLFEGQIFSEIEKANAFDAIVPALKFKATTVKYLKTLIVQRHVSAIKDVIAAAVDAYNDKEKKATAVVVSSVALDSTNSDRLKEALKKMTDREVTVQNEIDESLLGGFIVKVGSTIFDSSIKGQLRLLKAELMR